MIVKCNKGHEYDDIQFASCPICSMEKHGRKDSSFGEIDPQNSVDITPGGNMGQEIRSDYVVAPGSYDGATIGFLNPAYKSSEESGKGESDRAQEKPGAYRKGRYDPVVGWLVCIKGNNIGKAFPLFYQKNFVGRLDTNDVCLQGDNSVSREKHAIITYEPQERKFYAQEGDSRSIYYVNKKIVLGATQLEDHDRIEIGQQELLFVPLCNEKFGWDDIELFM